MNTEPAGTEPSRSNYAEKPCNTPYSALLRSAKTSVHPIPRGLQYGDKIFQVRGGNTQKQEESIRTVRLPNYRAIHTAGWGISSGADVSVPAVGTR